jgi:hypothetical protein
MASQALGLPCAHSIMQARGLYLVHKAENVHRQSSFGSRLNLHTRDHLERSAVLKLLILDRHSPHSFRVDRERMLLLQSAWIYYEQRFGAHSQEPDPFEIL